MELSLAGLLVLVAAALSVTMALAWAAVQKGAVSGWVDATWSYAVGVAGVVVALVPVAGWPTDPVRAGIVAAIAALWAIRLGTHIAKRSLAGGEDPRYAALQKEWGANAGKRLFWFLQIQAAAALLLAITIFFAAHNPTPGLRFADFLGLAVIAAAVIGEGMADTQLRRFAAEPSNKGKVCDIGLWHYSRHPNYFFQWLGWVGYAVIAIDLTGAYPWGWIALVGPAFMYWLLVHVSGIPPLEEHMVRSRGDRYRAYQRTTSAFWPLPTSTLRDSQEPAR